MQNEVKQNPHVGKAAIGWWNELWSFLYDSVLWGSVIRQILSVKSSYKSPVKRAGRRDGEGWNMKKEWNPLLFPSLSSNPREQNIRSVTSFSFVCETPRGKQFLKILPHWIMFNCIQKQTLFFTCYSIGTSEKIVWRKLSN